RSVGRTLRACPLAPVDGRRQQQGEGRADADGTADTDRPAHGIGELANDGETEPRADRTVGAVALVEVEALESPLEVVRPQARAVVDDVDPAGRREHAYGATAWCAAERVLDEI